MSLSKSLYPLLSTGSAQQDRKMYKQEGKIVDWDVKHEQTKTKKPLLIIFLLN